MAAQTLTQIALPNPQMTNAPTTPDAPVKHFDKQVPAKAHAAEHGGVVFASDRGKAKQYWWAASRDAVYDHVFGLPAEKRDFYEMLEPHLPCKVFYDLELDDGNDDGDAHTRVARMDGMQEAIIRTTLGALKEKHGVDVDSGSVVVLNR